MDGTYRPSTVRTSSSKVGADMVVLPPHEAQETLRKHSIAVIYDEVEGLTLSRTSATWTPCSPIPPW
jgi:hypothetical protein